MRTVTAAQRLKPEDEKRKQALIPILFDVNAPGLRLLFFMVPQFFRRAVVGNWQHPCKLSHISEEQR